MSSVPDLRQKYEHAVAVCDKAWEAYEASGYTSGRQEFRDAMKAKALAHSELRKSR